MMAVFKHELRLFFHSLMAYVFGAFLLVFIGIGSMLYNLEAAVSNFEYVLSFSGLIFVVIVPILTMRMLAEEKKQKTDQLIYSLPITTTQVILGKYFSLLVVFLIPMLLISVYPLIFAQYGDVYLLTAYASLFAFFMMGAALLAVGVFISSLTENQGFAAGIGIAFILFNYFSVQLSESVSATSGGSMIALLVLIILLGIIIRFVTRNETLAMGVSAILMGTCTVILFVSPETMEGLLPKIMRELSLFERFDVFVNGTFDTTAIVYYITFAIFFLFLSVQSLEKRRYN